jgi:hypothetical protein
MALRQSYLRATRYGLRRETEQTEALPSGIKVPGLRVIGGDQVEVICLVLYLQIRNVNIGVPNRINEQAIHEASADSGGSQQRKQNNRPE